MFGHTESVTTGPEFAVGKKPDTVGLIDAQWVVVLLGAVSTAGLPSLAESARRHGLQVAVITGPEPSGPVRRFAGTAQRTATVADPYDAQLVAATATRLADGAPAAILSWHDGTIPTAAKAAALLGIGRTPWAGLARARNKYATRRALRDAGLPTPRFAVMHAESDAAQVAAEVGLPAIVKPLNGTAGSMVRPVSTAAELAAAYREITARLPDLLGDLFRHHIPDPDAENLVDPATSLLVEGHLHGPEFCADVVVRDGAVEHCLLLDKFLLDERFFELGFTLPPLDLDTQRQELIWRTVDATIAALGIDNTLAHVEIVDDRTGGPTVVEVNAGRGGGHLIGTLIEATTGIDLREEYLALNLGRPTPPRSAARMPPPLANLAFYPPHPGRMLAIHGLDEVTAHPDVVVVRSPELPDVVNSDHEAIPLNVIVFGLHTRDELLDTYQELAAMIRWVSEPVDPVCADPGPHR